MKRTIIGVDPGKINDPTGLVVVQAEDHHIGAAPHIVNGDQRIAADMPSRIDATLAQLARTGRNGVAANARPPLYDPPIEPHTPPRTLVSLDVVHIERLPLGMSYVDQVRRVDHMLRHPALALDEPPISVWDITGVGQAVSDIVKDRGLAAKFVSITGGVLPHFEKGYWRTPKADLINAVVIELQQGRLRFANGLPFAVAMRSELLGFRVKTTATGRDTYAAGEDWRETQHDDLVLSLAVATWWAARSARHPTMSWKAADYPKLRR